MAGWLELKLDLLIKSKSFGPYQPLLSNLEINTGDYEPYYKAAQRTQYVSFIYHRLDLNDLADENVVSTRV